MKRERKITGRFSQLLRLRDEDGTFAYLVKGIIKRMFTDDVGGSAAQFAYYILFSFCPFFIFVNALVSFFHISIEETTLFLQRFLPDEVVELIHTYLTYVTESKSILMLILGLVLSFYSISRAVKYLTLGLNKAYHIEVESATVMANIISLIFTLVVFVALVVTLLLSAVSQDLMTYLFNLFGLPVDWLSTWDVLRFVIIGAVFALVLALLYYAIPFRRYPYATALPGTLAALAGLMAVSVGFSFYVNNLASYSYIYGSLGTVIVLMMWLFMTGNIIILGGELNHLLIMLKKRNRRLLRQAQWHREQKGKNDEEQ